MINKLDSTHKYNTIVTIKGWGSEPKPHGCLVQLPPLIQFNLNNHSR